LDFALPSFFFTACNSYSEEKNLEENYQGLFNYLTKQDSMVVRKQQTKGLGLSKIVLEKIFSKNYLKRLSETN